MTPWRLRFMGLMQVTPADLERLQKRVKSINSMAQITTASHAKVPVKYVLGVGGFDLDRISKEVGLSADPPDDSSVMPNVIKHPS